MIAKCIICKTPFEQKKSERYCGTHDKPKSKIPQYTRNYSREYYKTHKEHSIIAKIRTYWQRPIQLIKNGAWT